MRAQSRTVRDVGDAALPHRVHSDVRPQCHLPVSDAATCGLGQRRPLTTN